MERCDLKKKTWKQKERGTGGGKEDFTCLHGGYFIASLFVEYWFLENGYLKKEP